MEQPPYNNDVCREMVLRDHLAAARTVLANERTILAYLRTALAMVAAGVGLIEFGTSSYSQVVGWAMLPAGLACLVIGVVRYVQFKRYIAGLSHQADELDRRVR